MYEWIVRLGFIFGGLGLLGSFFMWADIYGLFKSNYVKNVIIRYIATKTSKLIFFEGFFIILFYKYIFVWGLVNI